MINDLEFYAAKVRSTFIISLFFCPDESNFVACGYENLKKSLLAVMRSERCLIKAEADKLLMGSISCFWENQSQDLFHFEVVLSQFFPLCYSLVFN